jgi:glycine/D-amino acid oxidase-like deaminating enzyme
MGQDLRLGGFWNHSLGPQHQRPRLEGSVEADVCVVGAGYAGLWTAWALLRQQPALNVVIVEADYAGAGAAAETVAGFRGFCLGTGFSSLATPRAEQAWSPCSAG